MLSNSTGRLDDYWRTVSYGKVNVAGSAAYGWFTLPHPRSYYLTASGSADLNKLFADCTAAADSTVNFSKFVGINQMFNADLDGYAWGGNRYATLDGKTGSWRVTWEPPWGYQHEAPLAHEMGHGFGLPHANNSDLDSDPYDNPWDVMSDAGTTRPATRHSARSPSTSAPIIAIVSAGSMRRASSRSAPPERIRTCRSTRPNWRLRRTCR